MSANAVILKKAEAYLIPKCNHHHHQNLQRICIDEKCQNFFKPTCMDCIEDGHDHNIKSLVNVKPVLDSFAQQIYDVDIKTDELSKQNNEIQYDIYKMILRFSKQYKQLSDHFNQLSQSISEQAKDLLNSFNGEQRKEQSKEYLNDILTSVGNANKLYSNLKRLKELVSVDKNQHQVILNITPQQKDKNINYEATLSDIRFHYSSNLRKIQDIIQNIEESSPQDLIVIEEEQKKIVKYGCIKCNKRFEESELACNESCGHYYCKICLSNFKDVFLQTKKNSHVKCLGHLNKKACDELISRKQWEQILGINTISISLKKKKTEDFV